ncbi:MAG: 30S ribosomal protein S2 [Planctomycetes bacterium]|nr:30S ribosomal protein S2 [Planctomycetota bacterium]MCW8134193.1 30S ribosomal protein S2 [Planctomycetota bacterium]
MTEPAMTALDGEKAPDTWSDKVPAVTPETLIEAGFHFGHRTRQWDPRMKPYIKTKRNGIHIIDLKESLRGIITAKHFLRNITSAGAVVLFVGTKRQAKDVLREQALRSGQAFMCERWLGGTLTNFATIRRRLSRLEMLEKLESTGQTARMPKKMQSVINREKRKIQANLDGLRNLDRLPAAVVVVDASQEYIAIKEANKLEIPVVAITDTNSNPEGIDIVIPGNDDSVRGLQIVLKSLADACVEGKRLKDSGQGMEMKAEIRAFDEAPARPRQDKPARRPQRERAGRGKPRSAEQKAEIEATAAEAAKAAETQADKAPAPTVRRKPPAKKPDAKPEAAGEAKAQG